MLKTLTKEDVLNAVDELIPTLGIKDEVATDDMLGDVRNGNLEKCIKALAQSMGLPVKVNLSLISPSYTSSKSNNGPSFRSSSLVCTDSKGRACGSITAQVAVPENIPLFGSEKLKDYVIQVAVSSNCTEFPDSFIAIIVHELSHILLAALWSPFKDSELHADIVPMLLGFRAIIRKGRKKTVNNETFNTITTTTTTYGYLTDAQFTHIRYYIEDLLVKHKYKTDKLKQLSLQVHNQIDKATKALTKFRHLQDYLTASPPRNRVKPCHAQRLVEIYNSKQADEWESAIAKLKRQCCAISEMTNNLTHFTERITQQIILHTDNLCESELRIDEILKTMRKDISIMRRYAGWKYMLTKLHN